MTDEQRDTEAVEQVPPARIGEDLGYRLLDAARGEQDHTSGI